MNFVLKEGGTVYLGYKGLQTPIAVLSKYPAATEITSEKDMANKKADKENINLMSWLKSLPSLQNKPVDTAKIIRKMRDAK